MNGDKTEGGRGGYDYWVVKIDANGVKQWDKRFGGTNDDYLYSLQQTTDGGYILGGESYSGNNGDRTEVNYGLTDYWLVKIDANGVKQWDKSFGGSDYDGLRSLHQTTDGGYILGGYSISDISGDKTQSSRGSDDFWIVKIDINGIKQWNARFGGDRSEAIFSLEQTTDGGYILGGYSSSDIGGDKTQKNWGTSLYSYDYWVVKLGCPPSAKVAAVDGRDLCATGSVKLIVDHSAGVEQQWLKDGVKIEGATDRTYTATAPGRYRVVVYTSRECSQLSDVITVINSCGKILNNISISPNPSHGIVTVTYNSNTAGNVQLRVYDKTGKLMFTKTEQAIKGINTYQLNLSYLINGIYNLQVNNGSEQSGVKFVIEK